MRRIRGFRRLFHIVRGRESIERAVDDELHFHFDMTVRDLMQNGMTPEGAHREALRRFGDVERTRERLTTIDRARAGQERRAEWWSAFAQDLRYALRGLRLKPGFALAVIVTLGLGIGANATMFGIVDRLLFRSPTGLATPERVGRLYFAMNFGGRENVDSYLSYRRFLDLREHTTSFDAMTPYYVQTRAIGPAESAREMGVGISNEDLWRLFDVKPVIGRFFGADENVPDMPSNVVVLSYSFWKSEYGRRRDVIGEKILIGPDQYTVIGVAPEGFTGFSFESVMGFVPITSGAQHMRAGTTPWYQSYNIVWFESFARRASGVSMEAATADLTRALQLSYRAQVEANPQQTPFEIARPRAIVGPVLSDRGPNASNDARVATWLAGVALIVLLIACANVANLLLARALRRRREIAVRLALGVSRGRLLMQLLTESLVLSILGGVAGLLAAHWGGAMLRRALYGQTIDVATFTDGRLLVFVTALATLAGLLTGVAPMLHARAGDVAGALKAGTREGTMQRSRLRAALLVLQAAMSVVLLVGAGLFVRSLSNVRDVRLGFDADQLLNVSVNWRGMKVDSVQRVQMNEKLVAQARTVPGVTDAALALSVPFRSTYTLRLFVQGIDSVHKLGQMSLQAGSAELLRTMGTRILRGRDLTREDGAIGAPWVIVVNESMAKKLWPGQDAIGKCIRVMADTAPCRTVVGIAEDIRRGNLGATEMHYYIPIEQYGPENANLFIRTRGHGADYVESVRRSLQQLLPGVAYVTVIPMSRIVDGRMRPWRLGAMMFSVFGGLALVLAAIGLYSVIAYTVTQRTHEMGVRVALGAQARDVIRLIVREGLTIVLPGVVLGAAVALVASRWMEPLLFQVSPRDPSVLAAVIGTLLVVAVAASWIPARRAARVDPSEALRSD